MKKKDFASPPQLISGAHRLEAVKRLGWDEVSVICYIGESEIEAELAEIEENLCRQNLNPSQEALAIQRLRELSAQHDDERKQKKEASIGENSPKLASKTRPKIGTGVGKGAGGGRPAKPGSDRDIAAKHSVAHKTVQTARKRVEALGTETLERTEVLPDLAKARELDALAAMSEPEREVVIARAEAEASKPEPDRVKVSAVEVLRAQAQEPSPATAASMGLQRLERAWAVATSAERAEFMVRRRGDQSEKAA